MYKRLKKALKVLNIGYKEVSLKIGVSESQVKAMASDRKTITPELAKQIEDNLGISASYIIFGEGGIFDKRAGTLSVAFGDETASRIQVSFYPDVKASAGEGYHNDENSQVEIISLPKTVIEKRLNRRKIDAIKVHGDSMYPTIKEKDIIFVLRGIEDINDNKIYVIRYMDEIRVKRLFKRMNHKVLLRSDNDIYPDEEVELGENGITILGQVIYNMADLE